MEEKGVERRGGLGYLIWFLDEFHQDRTRRQTKPFRVFDEGALHPEAELDPTSP